MTELLPSSRRLGAECPRDLIEVLASTTSSKSKNQFRDDHQTTEPSDAPAARAKDCHIDS